MWLGRTFFSLAAACFLSQALCACCKHEMWEHGISGSSGAKCCKQSISVGSEAGWQRLENLDVGDLALTEFRSAPRPKGKTPVASSAQTELTRAPRS